MPPRYSGPAHGTYYVYRHRGCRCDACGLKPGVIACEASFRVPAEIRKQSHGSYGIRVALESAEDRRNGKKKNGDKEESLFHHNG